MAERKYEFRKRLEEVHKPNRRDLDRKPKQDEVAIAEGWQIVISESSGPLVRNVAQDLQDYLLVSMRISVLLRLVSNVEEAAVSGERVIVLAAAEELPELGKELEKPRSYRLVASPDRILICGKDERGVGQGSYYLEDLMNLSEAPYIAEQDISREPLFSPRMVHSGWGLDRYPDSHLNAMAHSGIDAILVMIKDADKTTEGYQDFNYLVDRAELYGIDVYMYSYLVSGKHPSEPDAEQYYDGTYGKVFKACPRLKGVILVGESCEFPSKDPNTTGKLRLDWNIDEPQTKPSPGWWPCYDYPEWLTLIKKVIHKHNQGADIVFWTYNWGWAPKEDRLRLIEALPEGITLQCTFEMFEQTKRDGVTNVGVDYTASFAGPGAYFSSEAEAAKKRNIKLYTMSNTGGLTWDIGVIPYEPIPYQWAKRHAALLKAQEDWGLSGLMESHHFGWWPSFVSDLTKWTYWSPSPPAEATFQAVAQRDFSSEAAPLVLKAWQLWSEGITNYIATNEDQYGPFRVGPSYPLVFCRSVKMPAAWHAMFGSDIIETNYKPIEGPRQSLGVSRVDVEIKHLERMASLWEQGNESLEQALLLTPARKQCEGQLLLGMNRFILHAVRTTLHVKQFWKLKQRLFNEPDPARAEAVLVEMEQLLADEIANAEATIPLVEADSRLGWEPSMEYMTDAEHLYWKIAHTRSVLESEFADYRKSLALTQI
ncbi:hypothetical protein [Paenibacillus eucommiae]|uniref:Uncharacterized protein n=1 Tax=Paenibacillus eucommiae TaxID=1355755 RepID=A0ABS4J4S7_9BACL|nr:hypothetical protein [Paenibacillus eucommiae]MBP1994839.1 hypothetical protein [Paenibacillus eucommiae]